MNNRTPGPVKLPVIIPRCPTLDPGPACYVAPRESWIWAAFVLGAILLIPEKEIGRGAGGVK